METKMNARVDFEALTAGLPANLIPAPVTMAEERLPFTVRVAADHNRLRKAVDLRQQAYSRHVPALGALLRHEEPKDRERGCIVLIAESKLDGEPLGTMRIQTNRYAPLAIEASVDLPPALAHCSLAEATRLGVALGRAGRVVKTMLFKAFYLYCLAEGIEWIVIGARPPLDRMYESLLFTDLLPELGPVPLKHAGNIPHRILALEVDTADARWRAAGHPMYDLYVNTRHPDIDIRETVAGLGITIEHARGAAGVGV
jgi:hypothetical protein